MTMNNKKKLIIILLVLAGCGIMAWVDAVLRPGYAIKSAIKLILFLVLPVVYGLFDRHIKLKNLLVIERKRLLVSLAIGAGAYVLILVAYFILGPFFDFSNITTALGSNAGVNENNFVMVALYISLINSFLEEFFFRGFAFLSLKKVSRRKLSYLFSAGAFSLYHVAMITNWFSPLLYVLIIISLFAVGVLFNWLNERNGSIYASWLVHMCANFAINTIGFMLFGIL